MENILTAIRQDLGHDDGLLEFGQLCRLFILEEDKQKMFELDK